MYLSNLDTTSTQQFFPMERPGYRIQYQDILYVDIKMMTPEGTLENILQGGHRKVSEAGGFLMGGHSVEDEEPKYGLAVFGEVQRNHMWQVKPTTDVIILHPLLFYIL